MTKDPSEECVTPVNLDSSKTAQKPLGREWDIGITWYANSQPAYLFYLERHEYMKGVIV